MSKRRLLLSLLVVCVVAVAAIWWLRGRDDEIQTTTVTNGSLDVTIQTTGVVYAAAPQILRSPSSGRISVLGVRVGDRKQTVVVAASPGEESCARADGADKERAKTGPDRHIDDHHIGGYRGCLCVSVAFSIEHPS